MSVSGIQQNVFAALQSHSGATSKSTQKAAQDGDPPSVEAAESTATKLGEQTHGGFFNKKV